MSAAVFRVWMYSSVSAGTAFPSDCDVHDLAARPSRRCRQPPAISARTPREHLGRRLARAEVDGDQTERVGQERVPGEDGDRLAEDLVVREAPAPVVVVVHRRQVVVDSE